jgi:hypothetical protein
MIQDNSVVQLKRAIGLIGIGCRGTVVHSCPDDAYEVEFSIDNGFDGPHTLVETCEGRDLEVVTPPEVAKFTPCVSYKVGDLVVMDQLILPTWWQFWKSAKWVEQNFVVREIYSNGKRQDG